MGFHPVSMPRIYVATMCRYTLFDKKPKNLIKDVTKCISLRYT